MGSFLFLGSIFPACRERTDWACQISRFPLYAYTFSTWTYWLVEHTLMSLCTSPRIRPGLWHSHCSLDTSTRHSTSDTCNRFHLTVFVYRAGTYMRATPPCPSVQSGESSKHSWSNLDAFPYIRNQTIQRVSSWLLATWHPVWKSPGGWLSACCGLVFLHRQSHHTAARASLPSHQHDHSCVSSALHLGHRAPRGFSLGLSPGLAQTCWVRPAECCMFGKISVSSWLGIESEVRIIGDQNQESLWKSPTYSEGARETEITTNVQ